MGYCKSFAKKYICLFGILKKYLSPIYDLATRWIIFCVFFTSGWNKFVNWLDNDWDRTLALFTYEHPVPFISPQIAAILGTSGEIIFSVSVILGLGTRLSAMGLLFMTAIIEFTYMHSVNHILWAFLLSHLILRGPGIFSLDELVKRYFAK